MNYATCRDQMRLYQFLMALHDDYNPIHGQLFHQIPIPSLDIALNELVREETRLQTLQAQKKNSMSWLLHPLLHHFSILNLISLAPILVVQIGNPTNFINIARTMATLLRLVIAAIEALLLLLIPIQIKHPFLLLLSTLDPPSHSP